MLTFLIKRKQIFRSPLCLKENDICKFVQLSKLKKMIGMRRKDRNKKKSKNNRKKTKISLPHGKQINKTNFFLLIDIFKLKLLILNIIIYNDFIRITKRF